MFGAQVFFQPVSDIHTTPGIGDELTPVTDISLPLILSAIALCVLFIAWINYINLETARFVTQAKEVGGKKSDRVYKERTSTFNTSFDTWCLMLLHLRLRLSASRSSCPTLATLPGFLSSD
ncbi:MAG: hypothetical protein WDO15_04215 [Bacteroidota bacterium]